ncbi:hypothetical protein N0V95_002277 [Ascochyta clinopodiicola]|nr:hypothetical protein N0V95_002277 [Ascochyta clinopodiicola]
MAEQTPEAAPQVPETEPTPITNGTSTAEVVDVAMADSTEIPVNPEPIPHGSPTRVYLNQHVTPHLLEAMKHLAMNEPEKPLKFLSEFLAMKSAEIEG